MSLVIDNEKVTGVLLPVELLVFTGVAEGELWEVLEEAAKMLKALRRYVPCGSGVIGYDLESARWNLEIQVEVMK